MEISKVDEIVIVLGNNPWEIAEAMQPWLNRVRIVVNEKYEEGMTSSFKTGLKQVGHADAVLLVLGDQLILDPEFVYAMIKQMEKSRGKALIVSPIHNGKKGHPILFSKELFDGIMSLKESEVIRDVIHANSEKLLTLEGDRWTIMDMDTPKDFAETIRLFEERAQISERNRIDSS